MRHFSFKRKSKNFLQYYCCSRILWMRVMWLWSGRGLTPSLIMLWTCVTANVVINSGFNAVITRGLFGRGRVIDNIHPRLLSSCFKVIGPDVQADQATELTWLNKRKVESQDASRTKGILSSNRTPSLWSFVDDIRALLALILFNSLWISEQCATLVLGNSAWLSHESLSEEDPPWATSLITACFSHLSGNRATGTSANINICCFPTQLF